MTRKELSAVIAECAARNERSDASIRESRMRQEEAVAQQKAAVAQQKAAVAQQKTAVARQEAATARLDEIQSDAAERNKLMDSILAKQDAMLKEMREDRARAEADRVRREADHEDEKVWREEMLRRQEKMFQDFLARADEAVDEGRKNTEKILAIIADQSADIRAMRDAILKLIDRFPPPPPHLRSA